MHFKPLSALLSSLLLSLFPSSDTVLLQEPEAPVQLSRPLVKTSQAKVHGAGHRQPAFARQGCRCEVSPRHPRGPVQLQATSVRHQEGFWERYAPTPISIISHVRKARFAPAETDCVRLLTSEIPPTFVELRAWEPPGNAV